MKALSSSSSMQPTSNQESEANAIRAYIKAIQAIQIPRIENARLFVRLDSLVMHIQAAEKWSKTI